MGLFSVVLKNLANDRNENDNNKIAVIHE